jgi:hypothetical protein
LVLTRARRQLLSPWFYAGVGIALVLFLPNIVWLLRHDFVSYRFLQSIHARDVGEGRADGYWKYQFLVDANLIATPVWIAGLIAFFRDSRYRTLAWMYAVPVVFFWVNKGRFYYVAEAYPVLLTMGAVSAERWLALRPAWARRTMEAAYFVLLFAMGGYLAAILVPIASSGPLRDFALKNDTDLREEIGWEDLVRSVAAVRDALPPDQQASYGILTGNYGEAGAIENLGGSYHLPLPMSLTNSFYLRSYPQQLPTTVIVIGWSEEQVNREFTGCRVVGHIGNSLGIGDEESRDHPEVFVCGPPKAGWPQFWKTNQRFG